MFVILVHVSFTIVKKAHLYRHIRSVIQQLLTHITPKRMYNLPAALFDARFSTISLSIA